MNGRKVCFVYTVFVGFVIEACFSSFCFVWSLLAGLNNKMINSKKRLKK